MYEYTDQHPALPMLLRKVRPMARQIIRDAKPEVQAGLDLNTVVATVTSALKGEFPQGLTSVLLNNSHVLLFQVGHPWYSKEDVLYEQLFVRVGSGPLTGALAALDQLAAHYGCTRIMMGSLVTPSDEAYTKLLTPHGYTQAANVLIKEIP